MMMFCTESNTTCWDIPLRGRTWRMSWRCWGQVQYPLWRRTWDQPKPEVSHSSLFWCIHHHQKRSSEPVGTLKVYVPTSEGWLNFILTFLWGPPVVPPFYPSRGEPVRKTWYQPWYVDLIIRIKSFRLVFWSITVRDNQGRETVWLSKVLIIKTWKAWLSLIIKFFSPLLSQPFQFCPWFTGPSRWQDKNLIFVQSCPCSGKVRRRRQWRTEALPSAIAGRRRC